MFKHIRSSHWYFRPPSAAIMPRRANTRGGPHLPILTTHTTGAQRRCYRRGRSDAVSTWSRFCGQAQDSRVARRRGARQIEWSIIPGLLDLNPNDDCFLHNIAWIHALMGRGELAYSYLERALAVYKTGEYQISAGLILERLGLEDRAFSAYVEALALEPDIVDSRFSQDLEKRYPGKNS